MDAPEMDAPEMDAPEMDAPEMDAPGAPRAGGRRGTWRRAALGGRQGPGDHDGAVVLATTSAEVAAAIRPG